MQRGWPQFGIIRASLYPSVLVGWNGFAVLFGSGYREARGVFQLNEEGIHHACFHV
ncbi:hypothetical protein V1294_002417 [Bradyrhizobium sp. AZCC 1678]